MSCGRRTAAAVLSLVLAAGLAGLNSAAAADPGADRPAVGAPGDLSHYDLARKDCLGTARNTTSKVWYTVADGVLSDVYAPYIDQTNLETLQVIVTDGRTFTDLQSRDMSYTVEADSTGMACTVTSTPRTGRYELVTTYVTDPDRSSVAIRMSLRPRAGIGPLQLYVRYDASIGGNGGGGDPVTQNGGADTAGVDPASTALVSGDAQTQTDATNRDYAAPLAGALIGGSPFLRTQSGYAGTVSDGLVQLDAAHRLVTDTPTASDGNVVQTAHVGTAVGPRPTTYELALGFGHDPAAAVATAQATVQTSYARLYTRYVDQWQAYDDTLSLPSAADLSAGPSAEATGLARAAVFSANVLKASEDKTFPGAVVASLASPWGQAVSAGERPGGAPGRYQPA